MTKFTSLLIILILSVSCNIGSKKMFVSPDGDDNNPGSRSQPFKSPVKAKQEVRSLLEEGFKKDIEVVFLEGRYELVETLTFTSDDGGNGEQKVTYKADNKADVVFSGGTEINKWIVNDKGLWEAKLASDFKAEQLFADNKRATRARIPNTDESQSRWYLDSVNYTIDPDDQSLETFDIGLNDEGQIHSLSPEGEFEIVIFKDWATLRKQVNKFNPDNDLLELKAPYAFFQGSYNGLMAPYYKRFTAYLEGSPSFIDTPGEWAVDHKNNTLLYMPEDEQDISTTSIITPKIKNLVQIKGTAGEKIKNLHFEGIKFQNSAYVLPEFGHDGRQACFFYTDGTGMLNQDALIEEAIRVEWADNCSFTNCEISQTGGNGIFITGGSRNISIQNCKIEDIGGNGVMIGTSFDPQNDSSLLVKNVSLSSSKISKAGRHYDSAVGIWQGFAADCEITGNEVFDMPYTGISIGWQWNPLPTSSKNNLIADNHIHDVMKMLGDGGGIYTLGYQPGTVIQNNKIHSILRSELNHASPNNGMFIDEGSKGYLVEGNHIYDVIHTCIRGHRAAGVELRNNTFEAGEFPAISHTPPYGAMIFANKDSTIVWPNPGWPEEWGYPEKITAFTMEGNVFKEMNNE